MRKSGVLMPVFSLPSLYGIGCFGKDAYTFVDFLQKAGQSYWQILPIGPTGFGDSPYQSFSGFAGNPLLIDIELLMFDGLVQFEECREYCGTFPETTVDYDRVRESRDKVLQIAVGRFDRTKAEYIAFCKANADWLDDYALFMSIKESLCGAALWEWPKALQDRFGPAVSTFAENHSEEIETHKIIQYLFFSQWYALKAYANERGIEIIGDIPIYISRDSSDFWASPELFMLDEDGTPSFVAGCPPDYFAKEGQLWGNPLYDWPYHEKTSFAWWKKRLAFNAKLYDVVRIDHFRGLHDFWAIPYGDENAIGGHWMPGPDRALIDELARSMPQLQLIAEDLGKQSDGVQALLDYSGYPGMAVLQFAFDGNPENPYLPCNMPKNKVVYTATHDNPTTVQWCAEDPESAAFASRWLKSASAEETVSRMIDMAMASPADTAVIPMFDWLELDGTFRINTPSTLGGNWNARIPYAMISDELAARIKERTECYFRI